MDTQKKARVLVVGATPDQVNKQKKVRDILSLFDAKLGDVAYTGFAVDPMCAEKVSTVGGLTSVKSGIKQFVSRFLKSGEQIPRFNYVIFDHGVAYQVADIEYVLKELSTISDNIVIPYNGYNMYNTPDPTAVTMISKNMAAPKAPIFPKFLTRHGDRDERCDIDLSDASCQFTIKHCNMLKKMTGASDVLVKIHDRNPVFMIQMAKASGRSGGGRNLCLGVLAAGALVAASSLLSLSS
jgi:hypothetical protein